MPSWGNFALISLITVMVQSESMTVNTSYEYLRWLVLNNISHSSQWIMFVNLQICYSDFSLLVSFVFPIRGRTLVVCGHYSCPYRCYIILRHLPRNFRYPTMYEMYDNVYL
jgi:hypothetical protein